MAVIAAQASKIAFRKAWRMLGKPTIKVIHPMTKWQLPDGINYDRKLDRFVNALGNETLVNYAEMVGVILPCVPQPTSRRMTLTVIGVTATQQPQVTLLWDAKTEALVRQAWGAVLQGETYHIGNINTIPPHVAEPVEIVLDLSETGRQ